MSTSTYTRRTQRAYRRDLLAESFAKVPLGFKILKGPIDPSNHSIYQMDIYNSPRFGEYFRIWPGSRDNEIEVISIDHAVRQLLLRVKEAQRIYTQEVLKREWIRQSDVEERARAAGGRIREETKLAWILELWTPAEERRFLCGKDDINFFIAQVRARHTVAEAHESLKPQLVVAAEARWPELVLRQGEWFFLPIALSKAVELVHQMRERPRAMKRNRPVGPGGRPHVAAELMKIDAWITRGRRQHRSEEVYARGYVRHPDHRPLQLKEWHRVVRNREVNPSTSDRLRLRWID